MKKQHCVDKHADMRRFGDKIADRKNCDANNKNDTHLGNSDARNKTDKKSVTT